MPDVPVALVTHPHLFRTGTGVTDWVALQQSRKGPVLKSEAWLAPYDRVLFLDTDMLILGDVTNVFALLERFDIVSTFEPNARPDRGLEAGVPICFPELNNAFLAFRKTPEVRRFFDVWLAEFDDLRDRRGVTANQPAFRIALWKCNFIRYVTLGHEYNLLLHAACSVSDRVLILHDRSPDRVRMARTLNQRVGPRAVVSGYGPVFGYFTRRGWIRQFAWLSWRFLNVLIRPRPVKEQEPAPTIWWNDEVDCRQWND
jgi:hypothetical protein